MRTHRSKVDGWLAALLLSAAGTCLWAGWQVLSRHAGLTGALIAVTLVALGTVFPLWVLLSTRYTLDADDGILHVHSGPFHYRIPIQDITGIEKSRSALSSPALSLDRLRIAYDPGSAILISPRDAAGFLETLQGLRAGR